MTDWITLTEASYDLTLDPAAWLEGLIEQASRLLDLGHGATALTFRVSPSRFEVTSVAARGSSELLEFARAANDSAAPEAIDLVYRSGIPAATLSEVVFPHVQGAQALFARANRGRFRDAFGIVAHTGTGTGVALTAPIPTLRRMRREERRRWTRAAAHIGAGLRLREKLLVPGADDASVEAILTPDGQVADARGDALGKNARERLQHAMLQSELARGRLRQDDPERAQALWEALVSGRWSLVDRFDSDGRRFVMAVRNDPELGDPRGLSARERQVAEFLGLGRSVKEIGYLLGLSPSTIADTLQRAQRKLGLASKVELAVFFAPTGLRARLAEIDWQGESMLVGSLPLRETQDLDGLSEAERSVALLLLRGFTLAAIAEARGVSERTVANQVQAVYRKLGVRSRTELATTLTIRAQ